jgi:hypothetical protein
MDNKSLLDSALERGVITPEQRLQLAGLAEEEKGDSQERLKPIGTFNEIFVTVGVLMLFSATQGLVGLAIPTQLYQLIISAGLAWLVADFFHARKRFRLPIILLSLSAAHSIGFGVGTGLMGDYQGLFSKNVPLVVTLSALGSSLIVLGLFAWRYRVPFLMLPIAILFTVIVTVAAKHGDSNISYQLVLGASGLAILATAVRFDLKDPERLTRWSDFAFWSYVVGSPLFVHSLFLSVILNNDFKVIMNGGWIFIAVLAAAVSFVGLLLNRRALILSTLAYVAFVIVRILAGLVGTGGGSATIVLITLFIIGLYVVALGSKWTRVRSRIMHKLPQKEWLKRLPPY